MEHHDDRSRPEAGPSEADEHVRVRTASRPWLEANLPLSLEAYEKAALERALVCSWGDAAEAARLLGIGRSTFYRKAGKHGIHLGGQRPVAAPARPGPSSEETRPNAPGVGPAKSLG